MARRDPIIELLTVITETPTDYLPPKVAAAKKDYLKAGQRQDSTAAQLNTVKELARMAGCYDAIDTLDTLIPPRPTA